MKNTAIILVISISFLFTSTPALAQREFHSSLIEHKTYELAEGSTLSYSIASNSRHERYQSRPKAERDRFDRNLHRYNNYSPAQKQRAQDKWNNFKQETTPEEREYILQKMRRKRGR